MSLSHILFILAIAGFAGWIDAVVGGGGLIQVPALFLAVPAIPSATALGTSKVAAIAGTGVAAVTFSRRTTVDKKFGAIAGILACCFSAAGALAASSLPSNVLKPIVIGVLVCVAVFMAVRPTFGASEAPIRVGRARTVAAYATTGCVIGFYDGFIGPGTGVFLILALTGILGTSFVQSSATSKVINLITYVGAIAMFAANGHVMWLLGGGMAVVNMVGGRIGAGMALTRGVRFARIVLMVVVLATAVRLAV